jgi:hypothetical protein
MLPFIAAFYFNEKQTVEFLLPIAISLLLGIFMSRMKVEYRGHLSLREGLALVDLAGCLYVSWEHCHIYSLVLISVRLCLKVFLVLLQQEQPV